MDERLAAAAEFTQEEQEAERAEIEHSYRSMKFSQQIRHTSLSCWKACGGEKFFPFHVEQDVLVGKSNACFGDCMNINLEKGPFLSELGTVPEDAIPKKFIWAHGY